MKAIIMAGTVIVAALLGCSDSPMPGPRAQQVVDPKSVRPAPVVRGKNVAGWTTAYDQGDAIERRQAVVALGEIAAHADYRDQPAESEAGTAAVAALVRALADRDTEVRLAAAHALGKAGLAARAANPTLRKVRDEDAEPPVREAAKQALKTTDAVPGARPPGIFDNIID